MANIEAQKVFWDSIDLIIDTVVEVRNAMSDKKFTWLEGIGLTDNAWDLAGLVRKAIKVDWTDFDVLDADIAKKAEQITAKLRVEKHIANKITSKAINIVERIISLSVDLTKIE